MVYIIFFVFTESSPGHSVRGGFSAQRYIFFLCRQIVWGGKKREIRELVRDSGLITGPGVVGGCIGGGAWCHRFACVKGSQGGVAGAVPQ